MRQESWFLFYEIDEDCRVDGNGARAKIGNQSHAARSPST